MPRLLDNWLFSFRDWTLPRSEAQESLIIWSGLFTLASVARRHVAFPMKMLGSYAVYSNLYVIFVGPTSVVRKSTTVNYGETLLHQIEGVNIAPSGTSASMLIGKMAETTDGAMTIVSSELGSFIQTSKEDMYDILSDLYDGKIKHDYETRAHGPEYIAEPCLNLFAATTGSWLQQQPTYVIEGGFSARTIYVHETTLRKPQLYYDLQWKEYERLEEKLIHDLLHISQLRGEFRHDCIETHDNMEDWYQTMVKEGTQEKQTGFRARKHVHLHKLVMLLSLAERDDLVITQIHFETAKVLLDYIEERLPGVFSALGRNPFGGDMEDIRNYLRVREAPTEFSQIQKRFWQDVPGADKLRELLGEMVTLGWLKRVANEKPSKTTFQYIDQS